MSLHLTILLWLGIIFVIAASIILGLLLKSKKKNVKNLFRFYRNILYFGFALLIYVFIFGIL